MIDITESFSAAGVVFKGVGKVVCNPKSSVSIGAGSVIYTPITILGEGNEVSIGENCILLGGITLKCHRSVLKIGSKVTWGSVNLMMHESNTIIIGDDCMFSTNIFMDVSDMHSIYDLNTNMRINPSEPIVLGSHVWVGYGVTLLRGTTIANGSIVGAGSVVKGAFNDADCIIAGNPGRVVKRGIRWDRHLMPESGNFCG